MKSTKTSIFPLGFPRPKNPGRSAGAGPGRRGGLRLQLPSALEGGRLFSGTTLGAQGAFGAVPGMRHGTMGSSRLGGFPWDAPGWFNLNQKPIFHFPMIMGNHTGLSGFSIFPKNRPIHWHWMIGMSVGKRIDGILSVDVKLIYL